MERKSIRGLLQEAEERLGIRKIFFLPDRKCPGRLSPVCFSALEIRSFSRLPPGSIVVISEKAATKLLRPDAREKFLARMQEKEISCIAFADDREPSEEIKRFCAENKIVLFSSSFDESYLLSRITGLIREKIFKTVVIHGVLVNLYDFGLLITGEAGVGKTTCGLALAKRGHIWVADDLIEVVKRGKRLYGRGYGSAGRLVALRDKGIVECRSHSGITRAASASSIQLWCELRADQETSSMEQERTIMNIPLPFTNFPSFAIHGDTPTLIENWAKTFAAPKEMS